ncbi:MAG TPA: HD domain-containing protein [Candidatus Diapherotrites archaeon]|uniref:HD domain-containing protein n=1 Tax=Candidatus Iainarchaeum sp. TaxID=3101447 RepID=A0A7J4IX21_9ARCH|nr:HD domain-containing protein [Candidatus Diapherotrites archaeon]
MYHHFTGNNLTDSEKVQRFVLRAILASKVPNSRRDDSIEWELKHSSSCIQTGRILAQKRGLDGALVEMVAALHDIYAIRTGRFKDHARHGAKMAGKILKKITKLPKKKISLIANAIANHSDKQVYSSDPYVEIAKDMDTLDCFLYGREIYNEKPPAIRKEYLRRIISIRAELGLPEEKYFIKELERLKNGK